MIAGPHGDARAKPDRPRGRLWLAAGVSVALHLVVAGAVLSARPRNEVAAPLNVVAMAFMAQEPPAELPVAEPPAPEPASPPPAVPAPLPVAMPSPVAAHPARPAPPRLRTPAAPRSASKEADVMSSAPMQTGPTPIAAAVPIVPAHPVAGTDMNRPPPYPPLAQRRGEEGLVMLRVAVTADGQPASVAILRSSGHESLDQAAVEAVRTWRFVPATRGDVPIAAVADVPVAFSLPH